MGELAELAFMYRAASEGTGVARPYGDSHAYDFLVQHGRKLARVQVKSCFTARHRHGQRGYPIRTRHLISKGGLPYSTEDIDFIAAYVAPYQAWYVIPIEALESNKPIRLYPGGRSKRAGGFYETYREAWHLLKQPEPTETSENRENRMYPKNDETTVPPAHT